MRQSQPARLKRRQPDRRNEERRRSDRHARRRDDPAPEARSDWLLPYAQANAIIECRRRRQSREFIEYIPHRAESRGTFLARGTNGQVSFHPTSLCDRKFAIQVGDQLFFRLCAVHVDDLISRPGWPEIAPAPLAPTAPTPLAVSRKRERARISGHSPSSPKPWLFDRNPSPDTYAARPPHAASRGETRRRGVSDRYDRAESNPPRW